MWVFWDGTAPEQNRARRAVQAAVAATSSVTIRQNWKRSLLLHWQAASVHTTAAGEGRKVDYVRKWLISVLPPGYKQWRVQPEEGDQAALPAPTVEVAASATMEGSCADSPSPGLLALKVASLLTNGDIGSTAAGTLHFGEKLGEGSYGAVFKARVQDSDCDVAAKLFKGICMWPWAHREITAAAALPLHENIVRPLDVMTLKDNIALLYPLYEGTLTARISMGGETRRPMVEEERRHVGASLLAGLAHMHRHGIIHGDVKPGNVLVRGNGLGDAFRDEASDAFWARVVDLPRSWPMVLADVGTAEPADPVHRRLIQRPPSEAMRVGTLWYRSPELCLGDLRFGTGVDSWAVACVLVELVLESPLFRQMFVSLFFIPQTALAGRGSHEIR